VAELTEVNHQIRESQRRLISARLEAQVAMQKAVEHQVLSHVRTAEKLLALPGGEVPDVVVASTTAELTAALDGLRSIARGIYPPRLDEAGLAVSLGSWRDGMAIPVSITVSSPADTAAHRHPDAEACLYFIVTEAGDWAAGNDCSAITVEIDGNDEEISFQQILVGITAPPGPAELVVGDRLAAFGGAYRTTVTAGGTGLEFTGRIPLHGPTGAANAVDPLSGVFVLDSR
jgi:signal transduction histidine kinase